MDDIVKAALKKWPNVPACFGWLALDARGDWYMRDDRVQHAGPFPQVKGSRIQHEKLRDFIERNYAADEQGRWFFQNGPQRVYVELEAAPWVWRLTGAAGAVQITSHSGLAARWAGEAVGEAVGEGAGAWLDEHERLFLATNLGLGIVHSLDMELASDCVERGDWAPAPTQLATLCSRFGVCLSPAAAQSVQLP